MSGDIQLIQSSSTNDGDIRLTTASVSDVIYLGYNEKFNAAVVKVQTTGSYSSGMAWKYWNGSDWTDVTLLSETITNLSKFGSTTEGVVYWATSSNWTQNDVNGDYYYWVKVESKATSGQDTTAVITYIGVTSSANPTPLAVGYSFGYILG